MQEYLELLRKKALSGDLTASIEAIDKSIELTDEIARILLASLQTSSDRYLIAERISLFFDNYIKKLKSYVAQTDDMDLVFWSASLIVHYEIKDSKAEEVLLNTVRDGEWGKAETAAVILSRVKHPEAKYVITARLKRTDLSDKERASFTEKLDW